MQSSTTSKTTEGYNIYPSKLEVQATSKSRNDRDDTYLPGQSPKVPLQSWGIYLQPTGPESLFLSVKQEIYSAHSLTVHHPLFFES